MNLQGKPSNPEAQIFVGDLSSSVVEADLYTLASRFGEVIYIRILRHFQTKESLGFAFVTFAKPNQATEAKQALNGTLLKSSYLRVAKYSKERDPEANLFLSDLPETATAKDLEAYFIQFGPILSSKVSFDKNLKSNRYGYVQFEKKESALNVLALSKVEIMGQKITVQKFLPHSERENKYARNNLYVRGFGETMTADELMRIFSQYGEVTSHALMHIKDFKGVDRHFAYICYKNPEDAKRVQELLNDKVELGIHWYAVPHQSKAQRRAKNLQDFKKKIEDWKKRNLFIKGFPITLTESQLTEIAQEYGKIDSVKILRTENIVITNNTTRPEFISKGCGFVCFASPESASQAFVGLKMKKIEDKPLVVFFWKPKEELAKDLNMFKMKKMHAQMLQFGMIYPQMMPRGGAAPRARFGRGEGIPVIPAKMPEPVKLPFDLKVFYESTPDVQKRILGENLYPIVLENSNKKIAGKITGMLLEIEVDSLIKLLQNRNEVGVKVREAIEVLRKAWINNPEALSLLTD